MIMQEQDLNFADQLLTRLRSRNLRNAQQRQSVALRPVHGLGRKSGKEVTGFRRGPSLPQMHGTRFGHEFITILYPKVQDDRPMFLQDIVLSSANE